MPVVAHDPSTPRNHPRPSASPLASSLPFDWDAAVHRRPPPYSSPVLQRKLRKRSSIGVSGSPASSANGTPLSRAGPQSTPRRVYRKVSMRERISNWTLQIIYDLQDFPRQCMPEPHILARVMGAGLHLTHLVVRYARLRRIKDEDIGWEDMLGEIDMPGVPNVDSWFDWTTPTAIILITASVLNAIYLFTRIRYYHLFSRPDLVASPHAEMVDREDLDHTGHSEPPPLISRIASQCMQVFWILWCFLLGKSRPGPPSRPYRKVQRLSVWAPREGEMSLFIIYSPLHALLWQAASPGNWILIFILLGVTSAQLYALRRWFALLLKDREILAAEVMHEYDEKLVFPYLMRVRKDVGVMTHEAEVITFR